MIETNGLWMASMRNGYPEVTIASNEGLYGLKNQYLIRDTILSFCALHVSPLSTPKAQVECPNIFLN